MSTKKPQDRFLDVFVNLCGILNRYLKDACSRGYEGINPELLTLAQDFMAKYEPMDLMLKYTVYTIDHWEGIRLRKREDFIENMESIFGWVLDNVGGKEVAKQLFFGHDANGQDYIGPAKEHKLFTHFQSLCRIILKHIDQHHRFTDHFITMYQKMETDANKLAPKTSTPEISTKEDLQNKYNWVTIKQAWSEYSDEHGVLKRGT